MHLRAHVTRILSLCLTVLALIAWQTTGLFRMKNEEIASLTAQLESAQREAETAKTGLLDLSGQIASLSDAAKEAAEAQAAASASLYRDGSYEAEAEGYGGPIRVRVTIENDMMTDIEVLSHEGEDDAYYAIGSSVIDAILTAQSAEVDAVTGASLSSGGILDAVRKALMEAENT